jgi:4-phytase/acid phosphatase
MQKLHTAYFQEIQRAPYIAQIQGGKLLDAINKRFINATLPDPPPEKLVIYAGHDTNIANIAGIFNFKWKPCDLPENDTPPAGALVFELYQDGPNDYSIHVRYVYQSLKQLRTKAKLTVDNPPQWLEVARLSCKGGICNLPSLEKSAIQPAAGQQAACPAPESK